MGERLEDITKIILPLLVYPALILTVYALVVVTGSRSSLHSLYLPVLSVYILLLIVGTVMSVRGLKSQDAVVRTANRALFLLLMSMLSVIGLIIAVPVIILDFLRRQEVGRDGRE